MRDILKITTAAVACFLLFSCQSASDQQTIATTDAAAVSAEGADEEKAIGTDIKNESRKIIKTADFKARVKNVYEVTHGLEQEVRAMNGLVTESRMENKSIRTHQLPYAGDSLRQVQSYTTTSHLTVRIPVKLVDSFLSVVANRVTFIDSRNLKLNDVTLQYLSNQLKNRVAINEDRATGLAKKTEDVIAADEYVAASASDRIDRKIENLSITDQAGFATITLELYQPERLDEWIVPDSQQLMKASFGENVTAALYNGWEVLKFLIVALCHIWALLLLMALVLLLVRYRKRIFGTLKPVAAGK